MRIGSSPLNEVALVDAPSGHQTQAAALMGSADPVRAIAEEMGHLHDRLDAIVARMDAVEARISYVAEAAR